MKKTWFIGFESYDVIFQKDLYKRELDLSNILCRLGNLLEVSYMSENYTEEYQLYTYEKEQECFLKLYTQFKQGIIHIEQKIIDEKERRKNFLIQHQVQEWITMLPNAFDMHKQLSTFEHGEWKMWLGFCLKQHQITPLKAYTYQKLVELACLFYAWYFLNHVIDWERFDIDPIYRANQQYYLKKHYDEATFYRLEHLMIFQKIYLLF